MDLAISSGHTGVRRIFEPSAADEDFDKASQLSTSEATHRLRHEASKNMLTNVLCDYSASTRIKGAHALADEEKRDARKQEVIELYQQTGVTALMYTCRNGSLEEVRAELQRLPVGKAEHASEINRKSKRNCTALLMAAEVGRAEVVKMLLDEKADLSIRDQQGRTALMLAASQGEPRTVKTLCDDREDGTINAQDSLYGVTALSLACRDGHEEAAQILLNATAQVNLKDKCGRTALMAACSYGHVDQTVEMAVFVWHLNNLNPISSIPSPTPEVVGPGWVSACHSSHRTFLRAPTRLSGAACAWQSCSL